MYGALSETSSHAPGCKDVVVDLTPEVGNVSSTGQAASPLLPYRREMWKKTLAERVFSVLVRTVFASPARTRWRKFGCTLTVSAVLLQWYVAVMDLYLVWIGIPATTINFRDTLFASTENVWVLAQTVTFTFACYYLFVADKHAFSRASESGHSAQKELASGFLPREPTGVSFIQHMSYNELEFPNSDEEVGEDCGSINGPTDSESAGRIDEEGYPNVRARPFLSYRAARADFFHKTFIGLLTAYTLVTLVLLLDAKEQYFFDYWPTRRDYHNMSSAAQVAFWIYFCGFFWGMYATVTFSCLFVFLCLHLVRSIAVLERKLLGNRSTALRLGDTVTLHERLLKFGKKMTGTFSHWFIVNLGMLVIEFITIILGFAYGPEMECDSRLLYWLSVSAMTLVSAFQFSYPLLAASMVSRRWDKMVMRVARSATWVRRGAEYQTLMTYLSTCAPKAGFVIFSNVKISGGLLLRVTVTFAGLIGLLRGLTAGLIH